MATDLHVEGPYDVPYESNKRGKLISLESARSFWSDEAGSRLSKKQGCYIFAMRISRGFTPWYVGRASKGFEQEVFQHHKLTHYNKALFDASRGNPVLFFVTPPGTRRIVPAKELNHMEKELIQFALAKNPDVKNIQNTKNLPKWSIKGVIRSGRGKPSATAAQFKTMMGI